MDFQHLCIVILCQPVFVLVQFKSFFVIFLGLVVVAGSVKDMTYPHDQVAVIRLLLDHGFVVINRVVITTCSHQPVCFLQLGSPTQVFILFINLSYCTQAGKRKQDNQYSSSHKHFRSLLYSDTGNNNGKGGRFNKANVLE